MKKNVRVKIAPVSKMLKTSQIVAKSIVRVFVLMVMLAAASYFLAPAGTVAKMHTTYFVVHNKFTLVSPAILVMAFIGLFILCVRTKYKEIEFNWLLVLSTVILMAYFVMLYVRVLQLLK